MYVAKLRKDPDRVRPPQRGEDKRRIGQEKKLTLVSWTFFRPYIRSEVDEQILIHDSILFNCHSFSPRFCFRDFSLNSSFVVMFIFFHF